MNYTKEQTSSIHSQTFAYLEVEEHDHVLTLTLNRPEKKNAMNEVVVNELAFAMSYAHHNSDIWAVVLGANGDIYCAGADMKAFMGEKDENSGSTIPKPEHKVILGNLFNGLHKPCIAKIHAPIMAGGFLLFCGCTQVIATTNVTFALPEVKRGIWPMQVMASLAEIIPGRKLLDLCMRGKKLTANEALELGLATEVVGPEELDNAVAQLVTDIKTNSPSAIRLGLKAFQDMKTISADEQHGYLQKMLMEVIQTKDAMEGISAFGEKREAKWTGE